MQQNRKLHDNLNGKPRCTKKKDSMLERRQSVQEGREKCFRARLWDQLALCVCVCVCPPCQFLNVWTKLYGTWYAHNGTWSHINGIIHKPRSLVSVYIVARQRLVRHLPIRKNSSKGRRIFGRVIFYTVRVMWNEIRRLVLPETPCCWVLRTVFTC
jgi:hypothetical protein